MSLNDEFQGLLSQERTTSECQQSVTLLQVLSTEDFRSLILSRDKINLQSQRVIIDQPIVIDKILHINCQNRSTLKFQGEGSLIFRRMDTTIDLEDLQEDNHNEICGCVFEVEGQTRTILEVDGGLKLMDCQLKSLSKMNLVSFNEYLRISSCIIEGFDRVGNFNGQHIEFSIENTMVNGGILLQCTDDIKINEGKISIIKNKIKGGIFGINLNEGIFTEIIIYNNSFKNSQFGIQISKCSGGQLQIMDNKVYNQSKYAIRLEQQCNFLNQLGWNQIEISGNIIGDSQTGIQLYDIQSNHQGQMDCVKIRNNTIRNILQTALIIRDCLALHISDCRIIENVIGVDVSISTNHKTQCKINPFIITFTNCLINNNQVHGLFIHANLQQNPIYLLISRCTFKFNNNILSMAHMGDESQENKKLFPISLYACHCEDNNKTYQNNPHFNISFNQTNIIMQKTKQKLKDNKSHCTLQ